MTPRIDQSTLTPSLEDYLETIYLVAQKKKVVRIRDIAAARSVRAASVTPAMRRLEEMGLIEYERREFIELTESGEIHARKVLARHQVLTYFFRDALEMDDDAAEQQACALEHHLTDDAMNRIVRFFEYVSTCPDAPVDLFERYRNCTKIHGDAISSANLSKRCRKCVVSERRLIDLNAGETGKVIRVETKGKVRQRMLDMGILPGVELLLEKKTPSGDPVWILIGGYSLSLKKAEASGVILD